MLTHLDLDHAGGLADFPRARVHVFGDELDAALHPTAAGEGPATSPAQWAHGPAVGRATRCAGDAWFGFDSVTALGDDVLLIPLQGHTRGHCGVAVRRPDGGWLLHAGDSYFHAGEKLTPPAPPFGARGSSRSLMAVDNRRRLANQERLRELCSATTPDEVTIFCAHDAVGVRRPRRLVTGEPEPPARSTRADGAECGNHQVDVVLGGDQGWRQADRLAVCLLGQDALIEQLLADLSAGGQLGAHVDTGPEPP